MSVRSRDVNRRQDQLSFKGNLKNTRYGWLRLTPAYSVHLVNEILDTVDPASGRVLDPFCGTGTTALVCAERGIACDTTDINPFLLWLVSAKVGTYADAHLQAFRERAELVCLELEDTGRTAGWVPPLHQIEKWWDADTLDALARGIAAIHRVQSETPVEVANLLKVAFCRVMIQRANVSFGHQSMSFKKQSEEGQPSLVRAPRTGIGAEWTETVELIADAARTAVIRAPRPVLCDARDLGAALEPSTYSCVVTSPPYSNRMSYIRELRPYMYWLGYLNDGREAGELDWKAIGGTWGCATSNVGKWKPASDVAIPFQSFESILGRIAEHSPLLSKYVHRYFFDMVHHISSLYQVAAPGATVHYVVGNSKFYDVLLPVEEIFAALFEGAGFEAAEIQPIRKRSSKKELFEYVVRARKPGQGRISASGTP